MASPAPASAVRILDDGAALEVVLNGEPRRFHAMWLRDNAQDPSTRGAHHGQRLITLLEIPATTRIADASWAEGRLRLRFEPENRVMAFSPAWLSAHAYDKPAPTGFGWIAPGRVPWDGDLASQLPLESFADVAHRMDARLRWLGALRRYGFARLSGVPTAPGFAAHVAELFGYVRETHYGRVFDVRTEAAPNNLASTALGLQAHTDNPYRDPAPGLQILVCLENTVEGGETLLVDGFKVAERVLAETPSGFQLLARYCARFEYAGSAGVKLKSKRPILELAPDGELLAIRFNNRSAAPFLDIPYARMADYYAAYRRLAEVIEDPGLAIRFRLRPGDLVIVDNLRVLHGRGPITGRGDRWLQGCYVDTDGLLSTLAILEEADGGEGALDAPPPRR